MLLSEFQEHTPRNYNLIPNYSQVNNGALTRSESFLNKIQRCQKITYSQDIVFSNNY